MTDIDPGRLLSRVVLFRPWLPNDLLTVAVGNGIGAILIAVGWYEASDQSTVRAQLGSLTIGVIGMCVSGLVNALWLLKGRQVIGLSRVSLLPTPTRSSGSPIAFLDTPETLVVTAKGMTRFHRPDCVMAQNKQVSAVSVAQPAMIGLSPCEICRPVSRA